MSHQSAFATRPRRSTSFWSKRQPSGFASGLAAYFSCQGWKYRPGLDFN